MHTGAAAPRCAALPDRSLQGPARAAAVGPRAQLRTCRTGAPPPGPEAPARLPNVLRPASRPAYLALRRNSSSNCRAEPTSATAAVASAATAAPAAMLPPPDTRSRAPEARWGGTDAREAAHGKATPPATRAHPCPTMPRLPALYATPPGRETREAWSHRPWRGVPLREPPRFVFLC